MRCAASDRDRGPAALVRRLPVIALLGFLLAAPARAQTTVATISVTAVVEAPISGGAVRSISFGYFALGGTTIVVPAETQSACASCDAGKWEFVNLSASDHPATRFVRVTFSALPSTLTGPDGSTIPLDWTGAAEACVSLRGAQLHCYGAYTPIQGVGTSFQINGSGAPAQVLPDQAGRDFVVYLGGRATPASLQHAGQYSAVVTLQFAYSSV